MSPLHGIAGLGRQRLSLGLQVRRAAAVAAAGDGEAEEEAEEVEDSTFPAAFRELTIDRGDPPNYYLLVAGMNFTISTLFLVHFSEFHCFCTHEMPPFSWICVNPS